MEVSQAIPCLFLCSESFPPPYPFLSHVFGRLCRKQGYHFSWVMPCENLASLEERVWEENEVLLLPKVRPKKVLGLLTGYWEHYRAVVGAVERLLAGGLSPELVQVRDDPVMALVGWRLARRLKVPFIFQLSHLKEEEALEYARRGIYGSPFKNWLKGMGARMLRNFLLRRADLVFPISEAMKTVLGEQGIPLERMKALPEGVDVRPERVPTPEQVAAMRARLGLGEGPVLIYLGTLVRVRGLEILFPLLAAVRQASGEDVRLLVVGGRGQEEDRTYLEGVAHQQGVADRVHFTGHIPQAEVPTVLRCADIGLSIMEPRLSWTNSPIKILEYMAAELPVVATWTPSQAEVGEGSGAARVCSHRVEEYTRAIVELLDLDPKERARLGSRGRAYMGRQRDFSVLAQQVFDDYRQVRDGFSEKTRR
jgi:glycosyltransferase involved in cell wall biosynthesis